MPFDPIDSPDIAVGKAIKAELWTKTQGNFDDHEDRIADLETVASVIPIFNEDVYNASSASTLTGLLYYKMTVAMRITRVQVQIFTKGSISSGTLTLDAKKATTLGGTYNSICTAGASIDFATASNYDSANATIDSGANSFAVDNYLRIDITSLPSTPLGKFRIIIYGEVT